MENCKNCGKPLTDLYCGHCGQKSDVGRISFGFFFHDVAHFFTHVEKGFLFTSVKMTTSPGMTVRKFIDGSRKKYQSPVSYFLIWITIYFLLLYYLEKIFGPNSVINYKEYFGPDATTRYAISHLALVLTAVMPFHAAYFYLFATRGTYYFAETIVATIYSLGTIIVFQFIFAVLALLFHLATSKAVDLGISDIFKIGYLSWFAIDFVKSFPIKNKAVRTLLIIILAFGTFTLWRTYGFPYVAELMHHSH